MPGVNLIIEWTMLPSSTQVTGKLRKRRAKQANWGTGVQSSRCRSRSHILYIKYSTQRNFKLKNFDRRTNLKSPCPNMFEGRLKERISTINPEGKLII